MDHAYHIKGTEPFGYSMINRYLHSFYLYLNTVQTVCKLHPDASVKNLKGYAAHFCYIRLKSFDTFLKVVVKHKDYVTANCIMRMLGDCVAVFHLIYMEPDDNIRLLRHCLYVIDGAERNLEVLPKYTIKDGLPENEINEANKLIEFNVEHRKRIIREAQDILDVLRDKMSDKNAFDKIVKDRNWKFRELKDYNKIKNNQYQWRELYEQIDYSDDFDLLSYVSQFAHGLSMSNLVIDLNERNFVSVIGEALGLLDSMYQYTFNFFWEDSIDIINGLIEPKMRDKIFACYDDKHRPSIEEWNALFNKRHR